MEDDEGNAEAPGNAEADGEGFVTPDKRQEPKSAAHKPNKRAQITDDKVRLICETAIAHGYPAKEVRFGEKGKCQEQTQDDSNKKGRFHLIYRTPFCNHDNRNACLALQ